MRAFMWILSLFIVAFGQPIFAEPLPFFAATLAFALVFWSLLDLSLKKRFLWGTLWYSSVALIQQIWLISHPYGYIYPLWILLSLLWGVQFGALSLLITRERLASFFGLLLIASVWTLLEWSRLFVLSGHPWNPIGHALAASPYTLQLASLFGTYGMSFWVLMTNLLILSFFLTRKIFTGTIAVFFVFFPFAWGGYQLNAHEAQVDGAPKMTALLVQPRFPIEEICPFDTVAAYKKFIFDEWNEIFHIMAPYRGKPCDLVALPEFVVPFGSYTFVWPYEDVERALVDAFGQEAHLALPAKELPLAREVEGKFFVSNAYIAQSLSNLFSAPLVVGLEDAENKGQGVEYYSAALKFDPYPETFVPSRYSKQVLVPMGEYIPFTWCKQLAENYGVGGSFTPGEEAVVWKTKTGTPFGVCICYEEIFGDLMRNNALQGAQLLLNLSSDIWYPHSTLVWQHLEHARLRTVEMGVPLLRACNTGMTGGVDALGRDVLFLGKEAPDPEDVQGCLHIEFSPYSYNTLYRHTGDSPVIGLSFIFLLFGLQKIGRRR